MTAVPELWPSDWRWTCPSCGRFIANDQVREVLDVFTYEAEGIDVMRPLTDCGRCGSIVPALVPMRWDAAS